MRFAGQDEGRGNGQYSRGDSGLHGGPAANGTPLTVATREVEVAV